MSLGTARPRTARYPLRLLRKSAGVSSGATTLPPVSGHESRSRLRSEPNWRLGRSCGTNPIWRSYPPEAGRLWGWDPIIYSVLLPRAGCLGLAGAVGTGSFLLTRRRTSHYGRLTNVAPRMNPTLQPPRGIGRRTWYRNELPLGERAAFFRFQSSRGVGRALGTGCGSG
jgi:hypothetical protein